jgi:alanine racemase
MFHFSKLAEITGGEILRLFDDVEVSGFITDSRNIANGNDLLFIALRGPHFNGNTFAHEAYDNGIRNFILEDEKGIDTLPCVNIIKVKNGLDSLQAIASSHRQKFHIPVIAITGSNGKTIVKEWLSEILEHNFRVIKSPGSYNSQVGVPISVLQINVTHELGIFEAGISKPGEMAKLEKIIQPGIGVFTSLGDAHNEGFHSSSEKLKEKFLLFENCVKIILNKKYKAHLKAPDRAFTWSEEDADADLFVEKIIHEERETVIHYRYADKTCAYSIPFKDRASIENSISCLLAAIACGMHHDAIAKAMLMLHPVEMRLVLQKGVRNHLIINDAYNADLSSLKNALDFTKRQSHKGSHIIILSDIFQSGKEEKELYAEVNSLLRNFGINFLIGVGEAIGRQAGEFSIPAVFFRSTEECLSGLENALEKNGISSNALILLKGSRKFGFEKIAARLSAQHHTTFLEIHLNAIAHNFHEYRKQVSHQTKLMAMVKAFSYGSGSNEIASLLQYLKADYLAVAYADEGVNLRRSGITIPIMVMNAEESSFDLLYEYKLEPAIFSFRQFEALALYAGDKINIHLEFETGMHRLGFEEKEIQSIIELLNRNKMLIPTGVFSHLASSEDPNDDAFTLQQIRNFKSVAEYFKSAYPGILAHLLNSAGIARWAQQAEFDMVRLGIGLYGIDPSGKMSENLIPANMLKSRISQIKYLKAGDGVSYNRRFVAQHDMKTATIPIGYADGLNRSLGYGNGEFFIKRKPAPILGTVCMDMTMVDITGIDCREGDEVVIFGGEADISGFASKAKTIPYEILSSLSQRITRIYIQE